jgi:2-dehydro-3-deoxyphosphogluconate aldolase/(4S)-4-hydroxy-2-oxoglutarate aldolase
MLPHIAQALVAGGVLGIEVTMSTPKAIDGIEMLADAMGDKIAVGVGTILDAATAADAIHAGAQFVVSPVCRPVMIDVCHRRDTVIMPGCFTPTEILSAWEAGADFVKLFPASALSPSFVRDVHGPLPRVRLIPTGGIGPHNAIDWLQAGAVAVGVGGALVSRDAVSAGDFAAITAAAARVVALARDRRGRPADDSRVPSPDDRSRAQ